VKHFERHRSAGQQTKTIRVLGARTGMRRKNSNAALHRNCFELFFISRHPHRFPGSKCQSCTKDMADTSRLFVSGLPFKFTENDLRSHFAAQGDVTDVKLFPERRIGFVGYKSAREASSAVEYFNRSFIRTSRIRVELARPVADRKYVCSIPMQVLSKMMLNLRL
jgi:hypothetical protein